MGTWARGRRSHGLIIGCLLAAPIACPAPSLAQTRELRTYGSGAAEAKLMLYYSSTVAFSPLGVPLGVGASSAGRGTTTRVEAAVEVSYLPPLSAEQRTVSSDKPEATNLAPLFARPRLGATLPGGVGVELSWIPPVRVFDVKANIVAGAISRGFGPWSNVRVVSRLTVLAGRVEGPITCNRETARDGGADLATYFAFVCHGNDSRDLFKPRHVAGELIVTPASARRAWQPYAALGARTERTRFDVGVIREDGTRDLDEPVLEVKATRAYGTAGASWNGLRRTRLAAEVYYAPGSVLTVRGLAGVRLW